MDRPSLVTYHINLPKVSLHLFTDFKNDLRQNLNFAQKSYPYEYGMSHFNEHSHVGESMTEGGGEDEAGARARGGLCCQGPCICWKGGSGLPCCFHQPTPGGKNHVVRGVCRMNRSEAAELCLVRTH